MAVWIVGAILLTDSNTLLSGVVTDSLAIETFEKMVQDVEHGSVIVAAVEKVECQWGKQ